MTKFLIFSITIFVCIAFLYLAIYELTASRRGKSQATALLFSVITLSISLIISVGIAELGSRVYFNDISTTGDNRSYFTRRWHEGVKHNRFNFRGQEYELDKKPGVFFRIAVIGDSFTYGPGISESQRFSNIIEREFIEEEFPAQVFNFGKWGSNTADQIKVLEKYVIPAKPDFILLQWYINDAIEINDNSKLHAYNRYYSLIPSTTIARILYKHSALYFFNQSFMDKHTGIYWTR